MLHPLDRLSEPLQRAGEALGRTARGLGRTARGLGDFIRAVVDFVAAICPPGLTEAALKEAPPRVRHLAYNSKKHRVKKRTSTAPMHVYREYSKYYCSWTCYLHRKDEETDTHDKRTT